MSLMLQAHLLGLEAHFMGGFDAEAATSAAGLDPKEWTAMAAFVVGKLAERREDRSLLTSLPAMLFGSAIVYAIGVPWLAAAADMNAQTAIAKGMAPFIVGDALKAAAAGAVFPVAWKR